MPQTWKTVRIFISSTFRDMHTERNHLVRFVFPDLKEKCRRQRVHLIDVDLRWGVREEASLDKQAIKVCFSGIDLCQKTPSARAYSQIGQGGSQNDF